VHFLVAVTAEDGICAVLSGVDVVTLQPHTLEDVHSDVRSIAAALGVVERGEGVIRQVW
jgi:ABC-type hemin transport system substrate-binding protein